MVSKHSFTNTRRIVVSMAVSADGFIARTDGAVDWLDRPWPKDNYGMGDFMASIDTILLGGRTYREHAAKGGDGGGGLGGNVKTYVFTHNPPARTPKGVEFVNEPISAFAKRLRVQPGKDIWIMGGGGLIASFLDSGEVDDFIFHVIPTFIGEGVPIVAPARRLVPLALKEFKQWEDGVVRLHYARA